MKTITSYKIEKISEIRNLIINSIPNKFVLKKDDKGNWIMPANTTVFHLKKLYAQSDAYALVHPFYSLLANTKKSELHLIDLSKVPTNSNVYEILTKKEI